MCQVYIPVPDRPTALNLIWRATSCHIFPEQLAADFGDNGTLCVDIEIGHHTPEEVQAQFTVLKLRNLQVYKRDSDRTFPISAEEKRKIVLAEMQRGV